MTDEVIGAVLAGGRGRRIGGDKPLLEVGGQTLVRRAVDSLRLDAADRNVAAQIGRHQQPRFAVLKARSV